METPVAIIPPYIPDPPSPGWVRDPELARGGAVPTIVTFKWKPFKGYRSDFNARRVNILYSMIKRHYPQMKRFLCVTDDPKGLDPKIETYPLWDDHAEIPNPAWPTGPSCFRRLKIFDPWFASVAGPRFVLLDIDLVPVADLTPIFERREKLVIWRPAHPSVRFCASLILMDAGVHPTIWSGFDPAWSIESIKRSGQKGSDQGWLGVMLGLATPGFTDEDGVHSFSSLHIGKPTPVSGRHWTHYKERSNMLRMRNTRPLPKGARLIIFTGKPDPWERDAFQMSPWIRQHYV